MKKPLKFAIRFCDKQQLLSIKKGKNGTKRKKTKTKLGQEKKKRMSYEDFIAAKNDDCK